MKYTFERSLLNTRTTWGIPGAARSKMYVPAPSVTPGSATGPLNVKYVVLLSVTHPCADASITSTKTAAPHAASTDLRLNIGFTSFCSLITPAEADSNSVKKNAQTVAVDSL